MSSALLSMILETENASHARRQIRRPRNFFILVEIILGVVLVIVVVLGDGVREEKQAARRSIRKEVVLVLLYVPVVDLPGADDMVTYKL